MKGLASMKVDKATAPKSSPSPLSAKTTALKQAAASLRKALAAVEACLEDGTYDDDDEEEA